MRNKLLAIAVITGAMAAPIAAQAQSTVGVVGGNTVVVDENAGIVAAQRPAFREYIVRERVPNYTIPGQRRGRRRAAGSRRDLLRRAANVWRHAVSLQRRERPDHAGRAAHPSHRSGGRVSLDSLNDESGRRASGCAR